MNESGNKPVVFSSEDPWSMPKPLTGKEKAQRLGLSALKGAWGLPGMVADMPISLGNMVAGLTMKEGQPGQLPSNWLSSKLGLPTPQSVGDLLERMGERHLSPEQQEALFKRKPSYWQGFGEEVAENIPAMLGGKLLKLPVMGAKEAVTEVAGTAAKTAAGLGASHAIGALEPILGSATPILQNMGMGLTVSILDPKLNPKHIEERIKPSYDEFKKEAPNHRLEPSFTTSTPTKIRIFEEQMANDPLLENAGEVQKAYNEIQAAYAPGMTFEQAGNLVQNLGEKGANLGGKAQVYLEKAKQSIIHDMEQTNPALAKKFTDAQQLYKSWNTYKDSVNFVRKSEPLWKLVSKSAAAELAGYFIPDIRKITHLYGAGQMLKGALNEIGPLMNLIRESNIAGTYYKNIIKDAAKQNVMGVYKNMVKLGDEAEKRNYTIENGVAKKKPNAQGIVEFSSEDII